MAFVVDSADGDYGKTSKELLIELINDKNNLNLQLEYVAIDAPVLTGGSLECRVKIVNLAGDEYADGDVTFNYNRMQLEAVFAEVTLEVTKVNFDSATDLPVIDSTLRSEIYRKYGLNVNETDFEFVVEGRKLYLQATALNYAYRGRVEVVPKYVTEITTAPALVRVAAAAYVSETLTVYPAT